MKYPPFFSKKKKVSERGEPLNYERKVCGNFEKKKVTSFGELANSTRNNFP